MTYIAGTYRVTLGSDVIGDTDGIYVGWTAANELIQNTDSMGRTAVDSFYRGGACFITLNIIAFNPKTLFIPLWPGAATLANVGVIPTIGTLASAGAVTLSMVKIAGPNSSPNAFSATKAVLAPDFPVRITMGPSLSRMTVRLMLLPYEDSTDIIWFTTPATTAVVPDTPAGYIAGAATMTWNALAIGDTDMNSVQLEFAHHYEPIVGDAMGDLVTDLIYQGSSAFVNAVLLQADAAAAETMLWPYGNQTIGGGCKIENLTTGKIGALTSATYAKVLAITPVASTPLAAKITGISAPLTLLAPGSEVSSRLGPTLRKIPVRLMCFPSTRTLFTITGAA